MGACDTDIPNALASTNDSFSYALAIVPALVWIAWTCYKVARS
jgi:hypothetical protein